MKTVLYLAVSVNGMIAGQNDEAPWSNTIWEAYVRTVEHFGNIIVGHTTYKIMKKSGDFDSFMVKPFCVVLSSEPISDTEVFTTTNLQETIDVVRQKGFSKALIGGGCKTATAYLQAGLIDEIQLDIEPILLGKGIPFLQDSTIAAKLTLKDVKPLDEGVVHLTYSVEKDEK